MKKLLILSIISFIALSTFAQTDSVKKPAAKTPVYKTRMVGGTQMSAGTDITNNLSRSKSNTVFASMLNASGIGSSLKSGTYTVLAPTDDAFKKLPAGTVDSLLLPTHAADLTKQVNAYIIQGKLTSGTIAKQIKANNGEATITTLEGSTLKARINLDRNIVLTDENGNQAIVSIFDVEQSNGLVDVITAPLSPKTN